MKALLISAYGNEFVSEIDIKDWRDIAPALDCNIFTTVRISESETIYVDDEGLYSGVADKYGAFELDTYPQPLMGRGLVLGNTPDGESVDTKLTTEELAKRLTPLLVL